MRLLSQELEIAALPSWHPAAFEALFAADVDSVLLEHFDGVHSDLRFIALDVAGLEQHDLSADALVGQPCALGPALERGLRKVWQQLSSIDSDELLHEPTVNPDAIHEVRHTEARTSRSARSIRVFEKLQP